MINQPPKVVYKKNGAKSEVSEGRINVEDAHFSYPTKKEVKILDGVKIEVKRNTVVAFVGASGCGKSSIISLIERFYDPIEGRLLYNDIDLRDIDNSWYH